MVLFCASFKDFDRERHREGTQAGGVGEGEAGFPLSGKPNVVSIPGPWEYGLSRRQTLNRLNHPGAPVAFILIAK